MPAFDLDGLGLPFPEGSIYEGDASTPEPESDAVRRRRQKTMIDAKSLHNLD